MARVAREHGVNANQVFAWRLLYKKGRLGSRATKLLQAVVEDAGRTKRQVRWSLAAKQRIVAASLALSAVFLSSRHLGSFHTSFSHYRWYRFRRVDHLLVGWRARVQVLLQQSLGIW